MESYTFDGAGNVKQVGAKSFTYDNLSRLTSATLPTASGQPYQEYAYDAFGNLTRLYRGTSKGNVTYVDYQTSTATNQLTGASYDGSGSMTAYQGTAYTWDVLQQLAKVDATAAGSEAWTHVYDAAGQRVWSWRTSSSRVDTFALRGPGGKVLSLFTKTPGSPVPTYSWKDYAYLGGQLLGAKLADGTVRHFDVDHLGSVRLETEAAGTIAYRELWPYGEEATPLAGDERMKFTGHERDLGVLASAADDLDYMHARYYKPLVARFLSIDPMSGGSEAPQSWNRYSYVMSRPLLYTDPQGLFPMPLHFPPPAGEVLEDFGYAYGITVTTSAWRGTTTNPNTGALGLNALIFGRGFMDSLTSGSERRAQTPGDKKPAGAPKSNCPGYWARVARRFTITNKALPGLVAPTGLGMLTAGKLSSAAELVTPLQWARSGFSGMAVRGAQLSALETGVSAGFTAGLNFLLVGAAFEGGVGVGSMIGAAFDGCDGP